MSSLVKDTLDAEKETVLDPEVRAATAFTSVERMCICGGGGCVSGSCRGSNDGRCHSRADIHQQKKTSSLHEIKTKISGVRAAVVRRRAEGPAPQGPRRRSPCHRHGLLGRPVPRERHVQAGGGPRDRSWARYDGVQGLADSTLRLHRAAEVRARVCNVCVRVLLLGIYHASQTPVDAGIDASLSNQDPWRGVCVLSASTAGRNGRVRK